MMPGHVFIRHYSQLVDCLKLYMFSNVRIMNFKYVSIKVPDKNFNPKIEFKHLWWKYSYRDSFKNNFHNWPLIVFKRITVVFSKVKLPWRKNVLILGLKFNIVNMFHIVLFCYNEMTYVSYVSFRKYEWDIKKKNLVAEILEKLFVCVWQMENNNNHCRWSKINCRNIWKSFCTLNK